MADGNTEHHVCVIAYSQRYSGDRDRSSDSSSTTSSDEDGDGGGSSVSSTHGRRRRRDDEAAYGRGGGSGRGSEEVGSTWWRSHHVGVKQHWKPRHLAFACANSVVFPHARGRGSGMKHAEGVAKRIHVTDSSAACLY